MVHLRARLREQQPAGNILVHQLGRPFRIQRQWPINCLMFFPLRMAKKPAFTMWRLVRPPGLGGSRMNVMSWQRKQLRRWPDGQRPSREEHNRISKGAKHLARKNE